MSCFVAILIISHKYV